MGRDHITDLLSITLSAKVKDITNWQTDMEIAYIKLDKTLAQLISTIENKVGEGNVLFVVTTANLLNMYLSAIYGQARYVETCYHNQIYLDHKLIEQKRLSLNEMISRSKELLLQAAGVRNVSYSPYSSEVSGDLLIEVAPGWQLLNEDNHENYTSRAAFVPFPIIFYGAATKAERVITPATVDRIAPTIAKAIRIRAPNACSAAPLH